MNFRSILLFSNIFTISIGSGAIAENKFLAATAEDTVTTISCSAPPGMIAVVSNMLPKDTYLARSGPSSDNDYVFSYFGLETRAFLVKEYMTTTDAAVAEICSQLEQGVAGTELQRQFGDAIQSDLLWWAVDADKDLAFSTEGSYVDRSPREPAAVAYISAKHVTFVTPEQWENMTVPNALGYLSLGSRHVPVPIISIEGLDTANARAMATGTKDSLDYCIFGYAPSELFGAFHPPTDDGYFGDPVTLPANQTELEIKNGVWSGCRKGNEEDEFIGLAVDETVEYVANCPAMTIDDYEVDANMLPYSGGANGGLGTNFAILCPDMTQQILKADCDSGDSYTCEKLAEFLER